MQRNVFFYKALIVTALIWLTGHMPYALAQGSAESEPNQPCSSAQDFGPVTLPFIVDGSLDSTPESPDVDFFKFTGTPGAWVTIDLQGQSSGKGTLENPMLGVYDSACNLFNIIDNYGLDSHLDMTIPEDGVFILAATNSGDYDFIGGGIGTYQLTVSPFVQIGSISGRIVDAVSGNPLPGDVDPFALVDLLRCELGNCDIFVNQQFANNEGRFRFVNDFNNVPLSPGTYQVIARANQYSQSQTDPFAVAENENRDIGDIRVQPFPVQTSDLKPCVNLPSAGGTCAYSIKLTNRTGEVINGSAWSSVEGISLGTTGNGSFTGYTRFQTAVPKPVTLPARASRVVEFDFQVPNTVRDGSIICPNIFVGLNRPQPFFNTVVGRRTTTGLFCIRKSGTAAFSVIPEKEVVRMFRKADALTLTVPRIK